MKIIPFNHNLRGNLSHLIVFLRFYLFLERGEGREKDKGGRKRGREILACNPGMLPDWELNPQLFGLQAGAQTTEPHQPGLSHDSFKTTITIFDTSKGY